MKTSIVLIDTFGKVIAENNSFDSLKVREIVEQGFKLGYLVSPYAVNSSLVDFLNTKEFNPSSTFYKTWEDIVSKDRFELFIDQIYHYASTYGTDFTEGYGYVPNDDNTMPDINWKSYKVITQCTEKQMYDMCYDLVCSGIALSSKVVDAVTDFISKYVFTYSYAAFNIDDVQNKEACIVLCDKLGIAPNEKFALLRYIVYKITGKPMLIKDTRTIQTLKTYSSSFNFDSLTEQNLKSLSSIFYRFKPLFLAMKNSKNASTINKIRRYAKKYHTPMKKSIGDTLFSTEWSDEEIISFVKNLNTYKVICLINASIMYLHDYDEKAYNIRNGKVWVDTWTSLHKSSIDKNYVEHVKNILYTELVSRLKNKACYVRYNKDIEMTCPTSEKNFVGNIPYGTKIPLISGNFFGIYWKNEWGTHDFDLSYIDANSMKIGWNSAYYGNNNGIVYSGDMTNAPDGASEFIYFNGNVVPGIMYINRFRGGENSRYDIIYGNSTDYSILENNRTRICDIDNVLFKVESCSENTQEVLGVVNNNAIYIMHLGNGERIVSTPRDITPKYINAISNKADNMLTIDKVLTDAGFIDIETCSEIPEDAVVLDLQNPCKADLINLFK